MPNVQPTADPATRPATAFAPSRRATSLPNDTIEERLARFRAFVDRSKAIPADPEEDEKWKQIARSIDEGRPHRKLFEGQY